MASQAFALQCHLEFVDGQRTVVTLAVFSRQEDAERVMRDTVAQMHHTARCPVMVAQVPAPQLPLFASTVGQMGIAGFKYAVRVLQVHDSLLIAPKEGILSS